MNSSPVPYLIILFSPNKLLKCDDSLIGGVLLLLLLIIIIIIIMMMMMMMWTWPPCTVLSHELVSILCLYEYGTELSAVHCIDAGVFGERW